MALPVKTKFPQPAGSLPNFNLVNQFGLTAGNVLYVHNSGTSTGPGSTPSTAYSTIDAAYSAATASQGDTIVVLPGHAESITGAAGIACDLAGVRIVGVGDGRQRPVITFTTATAASLDITAAANVIENLVFVCGIDAQTAMINISAADCVIKNCEFQLADATYQAAVGILTTDAADRLIVMGNYFHGAGDTTAQIAISLVGGDDLRITNNVCQGYYGTTGAIQSATTAGVNYTIDGNMIVNRTADGNNKAIVLHASTVGIVANNRIAIIDSTSPAPVTAAAAFVSGNYTTGAVDVSASTLM